MQYIIPITLCLTLTLYFLTKITHRIFMNIAIGRKTINFKKYRKARPYTRLVREAGEYGEWLHAQDPEVIQIKSHDGFTLTGHYLPAEEPRRTLLMVHGYRSGWVRDFAAMAQKLREYGCNLLLIEQRAHGLSEGKYIGFGVLERYDCLDWIHYLTHNQTNPLPIYLTGLSMGASTVLMTTAMELPQEVKGVIADCGFTSPYDIISKVARTSLRVGARTVNRVNRMCRQKAGFSLNETSTLEAMEVCRVPVLFVHGTADSLVPMKMTLQNYQACRAPKELLLVEGAEHCNSFLQDTERYVNTIRRFFDWDLTGITGTTGITGITGRNNPALRSDNGLRYVP